MVHIYYNKIKEKINLTTVTYINIILRQILAVPQINTDLGAHHSLCYIAI